MEYVEVKDVFEISNATMLVCDLFDDGIIADTLITDIGNFYKDVFSVEHLTACFSEPKCRMWESERRICPKYIK